MKIDSVGTAVGKQTVEYRRLSQAYSEDRIYQLLGVSLRKGISNDKRRKVLNDLLRQRGAIGSIEFWRKGKWFSPQVNSCLIAILNVFLTINIYTVSYRLACV